MSVVIKVENLSKQYRLGNVGTGSLAHDLNRSWLRLRGKEDPYLKIGEENDRTKKGSSDYVWALKDINFALKQGEVLGIIGRNGAGKSTLLKILSKTTTPTTGTVKIKGRVASLLEVGTGFHPELSGRENVFLNGAILGMSKTEIKRKFDEIVDFSGVERYIDTPVKRYSTGMYVRLAFGVAAHLESEILIVDEVLAVGDAEFQKKCMGKMKDVSNKEGRTVLFVSHNIQAIARLCDTGLFLKNGTVFLNDSISNVIDAYNIDRKAESSPDIKIVSEGKKAWLTAFKVFQNELSSNVLFSHPCTFLIEVESLVAMPDVYIGIGFNDLNGNRIFTTFSKFFFKSYELRVGSNCFSCSLESIPLKPAEYTLEIFVGSDKETLDYYDGGLELEIKSPRQLEHLLPDSTQGQIFIKQKWT